MTDLVVWGDIVVVVVVVVVVVKKEKNGRRWICGSATFFPFGSFSVTKTSHLHYSVSILFLSLSVLVVAYTTVLFYSFYSLVSCHPIDARFIGVHDHHSQVLKPLRPG